MRSRMWPAVAAAVLVVAVTVVFLVLRNRDEAPAQATCALLVPPAAEPGASQPATASEGVEVAESGYSTIGFLYTGKVTAGAVVENTTDQVAYRTLVTFSFLGKDGDDLVLPGSQEERKVEIPVLLPKSKVSIGTTLLTKADDRLPNPVGSYTVTPVVSQWLPQGDAENGLAPIRTTAVSAAATDERSAKVTFRVESDNCVDLVPRGVGFVLRNVQGTIVGGGVGTPTTSTQCLSRDDETRQSDKSFSANLSVPQTADLSRTSVNALCDLQPHPGAESVN